MLQYKELETCSHVFLQRIAIAPPLTALYDGPYKVVARSGRVFKVMIKGKVGTVTAYPVKPVHIECKPENDSTQQHKATLKSKSSVSKPTTKTLEPRAAVVRACSTTMSKPSKTGVNTEKNLQSRCTTQTKEAVLAIVQHSNTTGDSRLNRRHFTGCRMPGQTGRMKNSKHIRAFLYISKPTCMLEFPEENVPTFEVVIIPIKTVK